MKNMLYRGLGALLLCSSALSAAQQIPKIPVVNPWRATDTAEKTVSCKPILTDSSITYGNKTLLLNPDGRIQCMTPEYGAILHGPDLYFWLQESGKNIWGWAKSHFDKKLSKFYRKGNKYTWELWYSEPGRKSFRGITYYLEVLPDGRLKFSGNYTLPKPEKKRRFLRNALGFDLYDAQWLTEEVKTETGTKKLTKDLKNYSTHWSLKKVNWTFADKKASKTFSVQSFRKDIISLNVRRWGKDNFRVTCSKSDKSDDGFYTIYLDFRKCPAKSDAGAVRGGVNFKMQENMILPDIHNKNMLTNPSLECGLEGWQKKPAYGRFYEVWQDPIHLDSTTAYDGKYSLKFATYFRYYPSLCPVCGPLVVICEPGDYTFSFYAKAEPGCEKATVNVCIPDYHTPGKTYKTLNGKNWVAFPLTTNWKRYHFTFHIAKGEPAVLLQIFGHNAEKQINYWVDAVQLEKGKQPTAYQTHPVEGGLFTSDPDNFISDKNKINGKFRITTAKPDTEGNVRITVLNFFDEKLLELNKNFKTGADRSTVIPLPLDDLPGRGIFRVFAEYKLKTGETYYDIRRYSKVEFQDMPRPNKHVFCMDYGSYETEYDFLKRIDRYRKIGIGSKASHGTRSKKIWDIQKAYGIEPVFGYMFSYSRGSAQTGPDKVKFQINDKPRLSGDYVNNPDGKTLIWDYHVEAGGKITPEYQKRFKEAVKTIVKKFPHVKMWALSGELTAKFSNEWWGKGYTDQDVARCIAMLHKPFAEGVREANPGALVRAESPCNMSPRGGIAEIDRTLGESDKIGLRYDVIGAHPYRYSPENPDLDADTDLLFSVMKKHGYDKTPVIWAEGMHWGPYEIPQWGTKSSSWMGEPVCWRHGSISYDMGWTEKKSAAWYARSWLVSLKHADRVIAFTAGASVNNCFMDQMMTPFAPQLMANTLCAILGDAKFKKDIRFAPYMRTYIFEDAKKRPVAVVWNHHEDVDNAKVEAPFVTADFGNDLETVLDIMNSPRAFNKGKLRFQVNSFPLFFRGKPGTLKQMISAFENAVPDSGNIFKPVALSAVPGDTANFKLTLKNSLSKEFKGTLNGKQVQIPASGEAVIRMPLKTPLKLNEISKENTTFTLKTNDGSAYTYDIAFNAFPVKKVDSKAIFTTLDWNKLPAIRIPQTAKHVTGGEYRMGWNELGLFIELRIKDKRFVHVEYPQSVRRWKNDAVQFYIDTFANARDRLNKGFDEDDYEYGLFPNSKGTSATVFRYRSVEQQLGLATQAPPDNVFAPDIPCSFSFKNGIQTYRVFFPAKYLLPMRMQKGWAFGFAFTVANSDEPKKENGPALTISSDGDSCHDRPHVYPVAILTK